MLSSLLSMPFSFLLLLFLITATHASFREDLRLPKLLQFELPDKDEMCFYEDLSALNTSLPYEVFFRVVSGGNNDVDVEMTAEGTNHVLYSKTKITTDRFGWMTKKGASPYKLCFSNKFSTITHKRIIFSLHSTDPETLMEEAGKLRPTSAPTMMESALEKIHVYLTTVVDYQVQYRGREDTGRTLSENLNARVMFWSTVVSLTILATGFSQVSILKNFFSDNRPVVPIKSDRI